MNVCKRLNIKRFTISFLSGAIINWIIEMFNFFIADILFLIAHTRLKVNSCDYPPEPAERQQNFMLRPLTLLTLIIKTKM